MRTNDFLSYPIDWADILAQVERKHVGGADDRHTWVSLAASLQAAGGSETHWQIFLAISRNSGGFKGERDCKQAWQSVSRPRNTQGTIIRHLSTHGVRITHTGSQTALNELKTASMGTPQQVPTTPPPEYYDEKQGLQEKQCAAVLKSPLIKYLRKLYWGSSWYWNISEVLAAYRHGYDDYGRGRRHDVFRYYDYMDNLCKVRYCAYHDNGHRVRHGEDDNVQFPLFTLPKGQTVPCFYGEHLVDQQQDKPIAIVESEKTALIMAILFPSLVWIATGGADYFKSLSLQPWLTGLVENGRKVVVFPDCDKIEEWNAIAKDRGFATATDCYRWYNDYLQDTDQKADIADFCISRQVVKAKSPTMTHARKMAKEQPLFWDVMRKMKCHVIV